MAGEPKAHTGWPLRWYFVAAFLITGVVVGMQTWRGAYTSNLAQHPDEAAHLASAACVLDYCRTAFGSDPVRFAESYYVRYPKVALGHWPPMFHAIQAAWYAIFGVTTVSAILLVGIVTAAAAAVLFFRFARLYGIITALLGAAMFLSLPLVGASTLLVMADMLAGLFMLLAAFALSGSLTPGRRGLWAGFIFWAGAAVLTKESALMLAVVAPAAIVLARGKTLLISKHARQFALVCGISAALTLVIYALTGVLHVRGIPPPAGPADMWRHRFALKSFFHAASIPVFLLAAYGIFRIAAARENDISRERRAHAQVAAVWLVTALLSQLLFRDQVTEPRYFLPACFPLILLAAEGLCFIQTDLRRFASRAVALAAAAVLAGAAVASSPAVKLRQRTGYAEIASSIPYDTDGPVVLVSSDALGEGGMIVERLAEDGARAGVVLRASKVLSISRWMGENYALLAKSAGEVRRTLDSIPVQFIVIDINGFLQENTRTHHRLLEDAIKSEPAQFRLVGDFPLFTNGHRRDHAVQVYENVHARGRRAGVIRLDMSNTLGRVLEVRLEPESRSAVRRPVLSGLRLPRAAPEGGPREFGIEPRRDRVGAGGGSGHICVTAPRDCTWSLAGVPSWIEIAGGAGAGDGLIDYRVAENRSNESRSATIRVGRATFEVSQPRSAYTHIPFVEDFRQLPLPVWDMRAPDLLSVSDPPCRWFLDDHSGQHARVAIGIGGPENRGSLTVDKPRADPDAWKTQVWLPRLELQGGSGYTASVWLKADHESEVRLELGQRTAPYRVCGLSALFRVRTEWTNFSADFRAAGDRCGAENNRLSIQAGAVAGKLSIAGLRIVEEPPDHRAGQ